MKTYTFTALLLLIILVAGCVSSTTIKCFRYINGDHLLTDDPEEVLPYNELFRKDATFAAIPYVPEPNMLGAGKDVRWNQPVSNSDVRKSNDLKRVFYQTLKAGKGTSKLKMTYRGSGDLEDTWYLECIDGKLTLYFVRYKQGTPPRSAFERNPWVILTAVGYKSEDNEFVVADPTGTDELPIFFKLHIGGRSNIYF